MNSKRANFPTSSCPHLVLLLPLILNWKRTLLLSKRTKRPFPLGESWNGLPSDKIWHQVTSSRQVSIRSVRQLLVTPNVRFLSNQVLPSQFAPVKPVLQLHSPPEHVPLSLQVLPAHKSTETKHAKTKHNLVFGSKTKIFHVTFGSQNDQKFCNFGMNGNHLIPATFLIILVSLSCQSEFHRKRRTYFHSCFPRTLFHNCIHLPHRFPCCCNSYLCKDPPLKQKHNQFCSIYHWQPQRWPASLKKIVLNVILIWNLSQAGPFQLSKQSQVLPTQSPHMHCCPPQVSFSARQKRTNMHEKNRISVNVIFPHHHAEGDVVHEIQSHSEVNFSESFLSECCIERDSHRNTFFNGFWDHVWRQMKWSCMQHWQKSEKHQHSPVANYANKLKGKMMLGKQTDHNRSPCNRRHIGNRQLHSHQPLDMFRVRCNARSPCRTSHLQSTINDVRISSLVRMRLACWEKSQRKKGANATYFRTVCLSVQKDKYIFRRIRHPGEGCTSLHCNLRLSGTRVSPLQHEQLNVRGSGFTCFVLDWKEELQEMEEFNHLRKTNVSVSRRSKI